MKKVLQIDSNHPIVEELLLKHGFSITNDFNSTYKEICDKLKDYDVLIVRSRIPIDDNLIQNNSHLRCIARVGAGLENIAVGLAETLSIPVINAPEGNRDAVTEHCMGMLLVLMNRLFIASEEVKKGIWKREENRGTEICGKTVGLIGYGNMGKAFAQRLSGFGAKVVFTEILPNLANEYATECSLDYLKQNANIISLHIPQSPENEYLINAKFIESVKNPFYLINTSRGSHVDLHAIRDGIESGKILGAALDVLDVEKASFENIKATDSETASTLEYLLQSDKCLITPHIAGWTHESKEKLGRVIAEKIIQTVQ